MKKIVKQLFIFLAVLFAIIAAQDIAYSETNLLSNPGFEGSSQYWSKPTGSTLLTSTVDGSETNGWGFGSLVFKGQAGKYGWVYQDVTTFPSDENEYTVSAWTKLTGCTEGWEALIMVEFIDANNTWLGLSRTPITYGKDGWYKLEKTFVLKAGTAKIRVNLLSKRVDGFLTPYNYGATRFDNISLTVGPNLLNNSCFVNGMQSWSAPTGGTLLTPAIDSAATYGWGAGSLMFVGETGKYGWVYQDVTNLSASATQYTMSGWVKTSNFATGWEPLLMAEFFNSSNTWLGASRTPVTAVGTDWYQLTKTFTPPTGTAKIRTNLMSKRLDGALTPANLGTAWFDDISLKPVMSAAEDTELGLTGKGLEITGFVPAATCGLRNSQQTAEFTMNLTNSYAYARDLTAIVTVKDFYSKTVYTDSDSLAVAASGTATYSPVIPAQTQLGFYCVAVVLQEGGVPVVGAKSGFCVVEPPQTRDPFFGFSMFGSSDPTRCSLLNAGSIGTSLHWYQIESTEGVFDFTAMDAKVLARTSLGMNVIGMLNTPFNNSGFMIPGWLYTEVMNYRAQNPGEAFPPDYLTHWDTFIRQLVDHYKGTIHTWSLVGEYDGMPYLWGMPGVSSMPHFIELTNTIATAAKATDPTCTVGGIGVSGVDSQGNLEVAEDYWAQTGTALDGMHFNPYVSPMAFGPGYAGIGEENGDLRGILLRAVDIVETTGDDNIAIAEKGYQVGVDVDVDSKHALDMAKVMARGYIIAKSVPEVTHYLLYMAYADSQLQEPILSDFNLWMPGGLTPRPAAAAYAAVARVMAGATAPAVVNLGDDIYAYVFTQGGGSIAALWTTLPSARSLLFTLPDDAVSYDMMGNSTAVYSVGSTELMLTDAPLYLACEASAGSLATALGSGTISTPLVKAAATIADSVTMNVHIVNQTAGALTGDVEPAPIDGIGWNPSSISSVAIPAGGTSVVSMDIAQGDLPDLTGEEFSAGVTVQGRTATAKKKLEPYTVPRITWPVTVDGNLGEYTTLDSIVISGVDKIFPSGMDIIGNQWTGTADLSMEVWLACDADNLYLAAEVTDESFVQEKTGAEIWAGDGLCIGIDALNDTLSPEVSGQAGYDGNDYDLGIALTSQGARTYVWDAATVNGQMVGDQTVLLPPAIVNAGSGKWHYELAIPWSCLAPLTSSSGSAFGLNLAYTDIDTSGESWSYWTALTEGLIGGKNPSLFRTFILE
ncbi:MAG: sugar-binding protein [bacterium]|nr:sugar-binding protein [bacterium]